MLEGCLMLTLFLYACETDEQGCFSMSLCLANGYLDFLQKKKSVRAEPSSQTESVRAGGRRVVFFSSFSRPFNDIK